MKFITVITTCGNRKEAVKMAEALVKDRLVACANYFPIKSVYRWEGKVVKDSEYLIICKTRVSKFGQLQKRLLELHPYNLPEIIALPISAGKGEYLNWLKENTE